MSAAFNTELISSWVAVLLNELVDEDRGQQGGGSS
jgi:hypothetical protein